MFGSFVHVEAERRERLHADLDGALLRVRRLERREPAHVGDVERRRPLLALVAEQPLEPARPELLPPLGGGVARGRERLLEPAQRDRLLLLVARDRVGLAGELGLELLAGRAQQLEPLVVEAAEASPCELAQLVAVAVVGQDRELRLRGPERKRLGAELHPRGEDRVLELVLAGAQLDLDEAGFARLAQPVEALALVAGSRLGLGLAQRVELLAREELGVARDDLGPLGDLLLADADGAAFLGALEEVALRGAPRTRQASGPR